MEQFHDDDGNDGPLALSSTRSEVPFLTPRTTDGVLPKHKAKAGVSHSGWTRWNIPRYSRCWARLLPSTHSRETTQAVSVMSAAVCWPMLRASASLASSIDKSHGNVECVQLLHAFIIPI